MYPVDAVAKRYDLWAILLANKALAQYHELTGDARVLTAITRSLRALADGLERTPLYGWGKFRWYEGLVPVFHVYERTQEPWLLDLARKLRAQGVDFEALFATEDVTVPTPRRGLWKWTKHVVNTAMAAKAAALSYRLDARPADKAFATKYIALLDRWHGQVTGMFTGDECLAGRNPLQGTELCAVVEFMYSLEHLYSVFGDPFFADRLERVAFNALPATFTPDMWAHQYDQQVNQVQCTINPEHGFTTNGPESNLYGLEPNFGCCTSNMHQGWPKFVAHLWMGSAASTNWWRCRTRRAASRRRCASVPVTLEVDTDYPFRDTVTLRVTPAAGRDARAAPARAGVGGGRDGAHRRRPGAADEGGHAPSPRARVAEGHDGGDAPLPDAREGHDALQRGGRRRARAAGLRAEDRRGVDARERRQAAPRAAARRLRGAPDDAVELRAGGGRGEAGRGPAVRGAARGRAAVLARRRGHRRDGAGAQDPELEDCCAAGPPKSPRPTSRGPIRRASRPRSRWKR